MDREKITVVICAAGMGTRLGIGTTKALVHICGKPLIIRQLELLDEYDDVRVVVGYQAEKVIEVVNNYRKDVMFCFNYNYANTGAAASLSKGIVGAREYTISMDGDLLVEPDDFYKFIKYDNECIAVSEISSDEPVKIKILNEKAIEFSSKGNYEWPGLVKFQTKKLVKECNGHIYEQLKNILPADILYVECRDIDTQDDYERAINWGKIIYKESRQ